MKLCQRIIPVRVLEQSSEYEGREKERDACSLHFHPCRGNMSLRTHPSFTGIPRS